MFYRYCLFSVPKYVYRLEEAFPARNYKTTCVIGECKHILCPLLISWQALRWREGNTGPDCRPNYKAAAIEAVWWEHRDRHTDDRSGQTAGNEATLTGAVSPQQGGKTTAGKDSFFNRQCWANLDRYAKRTKLGFFLTNAINEHKRRIKT